MAARWKSGARIETRRCCSWGCAQCSSGFWRRPIGRTIGGSGAVALPDGLVLSRRRRWCVARVVRRCLGRNLTRGWRVARLGMMHFPVARLRFDSAFGMVGVAMMAIAMSLMHALMKHLRFLPGVFVAGGGDEEQGGKGEGGGGELHVKQWGKEVSMVKTVPPGANRK